ncbi:unnamed protein product [Meloidogyne enterolobii]|uniref:Uncharacterized protein n=1 Tax=Meloidogyne enterolobii TaxID=390850 RepID=A0ACB0ZTV7_MELEN
MSTCYNCGKLEKDLKAMTARALKAEDELKEMTARAVKATEEEEEESWEE